MPYTIREPALTALVKASIISVNAWKSPTNPPADKRKQKGWKKIKIK